MRFFLCHCSVSVDSVIVSVLFLQPFPGRLFHSRPLGILAFTVFRIPLLRYSSSHRCRNCDNRCVCWYWEPHNLLICIVSRCAFLGCSSFAVKRGFLDEGGSNTYMVLLEFLEMILTGYIVNLPGCSLKQQTLLSWRLFQISEAKSSLTLYTCTLITQYAGEMFA